jgi:hypothetical protein
MCAADAGEFGFGRTVSAGGITVEQSIKADIQASFVLCSTLTFQDGIGNLYAVVWQICAQWLLSDPSY